MEIWYRASVYGEVEAIPVTKFNSRMVWFKKGYYTRTEHIESADHCWFQTEAPAREYVAEAKLKRQEASGEQVKRLKARRVGPELADALRFVLADQQNFLTSESYARAQAALGMIEG